MFNKRFDSKKYGNELSNLKNEKQELDKNGKPISQHTLKSKKKSLKGKAHKASRRNAKKEISDILLAL